MNRSGAGRVHPSLLLGALVVIVLLANTALAITTQVAVAEESPNANPDQAHVTATLSADETRVVITADGGPLKTADTVTFPVWSEADGRDDLIEHPAVQTPNGSWTATVFIASDERDPSRVPYQDLVPDAVYRLYNPYTYLHLYTADSHEATTLAAQGWHYEGIAWVAPAGDTGARAIYRLFNPASSQHHYTTDANEYATLAGLGWNQEGVAFVSPAEGTVPVYRLYNRFDGTHHFTVSGGERQTLAAQGWTDEGVAWQCAAINSDGSWSAAVGNRGHHTAGAYTVQAQATAGGSPSLVGTAGFQVTAPTARLTTTPDNAAGTFTLTLESIHAPSGVATVWLPTWSDAGGQDDIAWYEAVADGGRWTQVVRAADHGFGELYHTHAYVTGRNGVEGLAAAVDTRLGLRNFIMVERPADGPFTRTVWVKNPMTSAGAAGRVSVPTWSEDRGQDDIVWYDATPVGDGLWKATVDCRRLLSSGRCLSHVYGDGELLGAVAFSVDPAEVVTIHSVLRGQFDHGPKPAANQRYIVLHDTEGEGNALSTLEWWETSGDLVAAHFVVNKDGSIYQMVPLDRIAHHAGYGDSGHNALYGIWEDGRDDMLGSTPIGSWAAGYGINAWSVGIEMVHAGGGYPEAQLEALDSLIAYIDGYYGFQSAIIDHKAWRSGNSDTSPEFADYLANYQRTRTHRG